MIYRANNSAIISEIRSRDR